MEIEIGMEPSSLSLLWNLPNQNSKWNWKEEKDALDALFQPYQKNGIWNNIKYVYMLSFFFFHPKNGIEIINQARLERTASNPPNWIEIDNPV